MMGVNLFSACMLYSLKADIVQSFNVSSFFLLKHVRLFWYSLVGLEHLELVQFC